MAQSFDHANRWVGFAVTSRTKHVILDLKLKVRSIYTACSHPKRSSTTKRTFFSREISLDIPHYLCFRSARLSLHDVYSLIDNINTVVKRHNHLIMRTDGLTSRTKHVVLDLKFNICLRWTTCSHPRSHVLTIQDDTGIIM